MTTLSYGVQHLAEVGGHRVEVAQVGLRDRQAPLAQRAGTAAPIGP